MYTEIKKDRWIKEIAYWQDDPLIGAKIIQLTGHISMATNIYCEDPACSKNNRIAVFRSNRCDHFATGELWVIDINTMRSILVDTDTIWFGCFPQAYGDFFFYPKFCGDKWEIRKLCFSTLEIEVVLKFQGNVFPYITLGSASSDARFLANLREVTDGYYEVIVLDLETKKEKILVGGEEFCNPHPRFDRMKGKWVLVQHNRGYRKVNGMIKCIDCEQGVSLVLFEKDGSKRIELPVSRPFIPQGVSGHEAWIYNQPAFIFSTSPLYDPYADGNRCGNLLLYRIGEKKPVVVVNAPDVYFGHVSTSSCGSYWCCDVWDWKHEGKDVCFKPPKIAVGSIKTGKFAFVCEVNGYWPGYEMGHSHPYLSADNRQVIFTSTRTGFPQVFSAILPEGFLENLDR